MACKHDTFEILFYERHMNVLIPIFKTNIEPKTCSVYNQSHRFGGFRRQWFIVMMGLGMPMLLVKQIDPKFFLCVRYVLYSN